MPHIKFEFKYTCTVECEVPQNIIDEGEDAIIDHLRDNIDPCPDIFSLLDEVTTSNGDDEILISSDLSTVESKDEVEDEDEDEDEAETEDGNK